MISDGAFILGAVGLIALYMGARVLQGFLSFKKRMKVISNDGLLRSEQWVLTRFRFPLIRRITFSHARLSRKRLILFHFLTRRMMIQAPLGPKGKAGGEDGFFEVEKRGSKAVLTLKTTIRGGGRIRMHVNDPDAWLKDIVES